MKFQFDPHQPYQLDAIAAVMDLFDGQPRVDLDLNALHAEQAFPNQLHLTPEDLLANLHTIQHHHHLPLDTTLKTLPYPNASVFGDAPSTVYRLPSTAFPNFSLEMETGTGKTYVYLRTALELYRRYGMSKFIVVVPSIAIREGVLKTLNVTAEHFGALYHNLPYRYSPYDSGDLNLISQFVQSAAPHILVMTLAAFNKDANVIYQSTDRLQGRVPIHLLQAARPILILDEPQNMGTARSHAALAALHPLFALRYSATHRDPFNLVYRLTPFRAYQERLVKRIEVAGVEEVDNANRPYLRLIDVTARKRTITATLVVHRRLAGGAIKEVVVTVRPGDNLEAKTNRSDYAAYTVERIDVGVEGGEAAIHFSNGLALERGQVAGSRAFHSALWEQQIAYTIEEHFRKQQHLLGQGIKVLSLFFIDRVDNYVHPDSPLRRLFNAAFAHIAAQYPEVCRALWGSSTVDPETVQAAYFANRSARSGETVYLDSKTGESQHDKAVYDLIMRNKERLLALEEPVAFIFSHSALREGWDNPNVFQICTLNQTTSEVKKRQEIGRGIRLAVNQAGARIHDPGVNRLTVIANESYQSYVAGLQTEYAEDYGPEGTPSQPSDARARQIVSRVEARYRSEDFRRLWERISPQTRYTVHIDSERLIRDVTAALNQAEIRPPRIAIRTAQVQVQDRGVQAVVSDTQAPDQPEMLSTGLTAPLPNLVALMEDLLQRATSPLRLSRRTLLDIYRRCERQQEGLDNPFEFANTAVRLITDRLLEQLVEGIHYECSGAAYAREQFAPEFTALQANLVPVTRSIYDHVVVESAAEAAFVQTLENDPRVRLYVKLPDWFTVPTPLGDHHPGWAIVFAEDDADVRYLVCEVQAAPNRDTRLKSASACRHFGEVLEVCYRVVNPEGFLSGLGLTF